MSRPTVAVVLPTYNRASFVAEAIDSILAQPVQPQEIIVVDDGSTDNTLEVLQGYGDAIRVINQANAGASAARNAGALAATSDWLTFLDSDDLWLPDRMALLLADLGGAAPDIVAHVANVCFKGSGVERDFFAVARIPFPAGQVQTIDRPLTMFLHAFFLIGTAFRREVFVDLGGFDTSYPTDEDTELAHRMADRGRFVVRGDVVAEVIRRKGDGDALSLLRGKDPLQANGFKLRHFEGILARSRDPRDRDLARRALSDALLQRAGLIRKSGGKGYLKLLFDAARTHPEPLKGFGRVVLSVVSRPKGRAQQMDRTRET